MPLVCASRPLIFIYLQLNHILDLVSEDILAFPLQKKTLRTRLQPGNPHAAQVDAAKRR